jgi:tripartite-type tricarboxylate transporter receptor subunit TctC
MANRSHNLPPSVRVLILGALSLSMVPAHADPVADFYRGKTINVYVGVNVGGGYDFEARLLARYMRRTFRAIPCSCRRT